MSETTPVSTPDTNPVHEAVRARYGAIARASSSCCAPSCCSPDASAERPDAMPVEGGEVACWLFDREGAARAAG